MNKYVTFAFAIGMLIGLLEYVVPLSFNGTVLALFNSWFVICWSQYYIKDAKQGTGEKKDE